MRAKKPYVFASMKPDVMAFLSPDPRRLLAGMAGLYHRAVRSHSPLWTAETAAQLSLLSVRTMEPDRL